MALPFFSSLSLSLSLSLIAKQKCEQVFFRSSGGGGGKSERRVKNRTAAANPHLVLNYPNLNSNPLLLLKNQAGVSLLIEAFKRTRPTKEDESRVWFVGRRSSN